MELEPQNIAPSFLIMDDSSAGEETEPLTPVRIQFLDGFIYDVLMASSDVDQKFLGKFAQQTERIDPYLSQQLYKILGLSVLLSKKLFRARRLRRLDVTRDTKSLQLYHHIIWLSREGLVILEVAVLPAVMSSRARLPDIAEMRVLAQKLQGSFYHIFVLFHNQPSINRAAAIPGSSSSRRPARSDSIRKTLIEDEEDPYEQTAGRSQQLPPGLAPIAIPKPTASFLLPAQDYIPKASEAFDKSAKLARQLLGGSHPLRLSVAVEYCAYLYDCLHDGESSRGLAKATIRNVYSANEGMDDETFADSANLVSVLGKMMKRGLGSSTAGSKTPSVNTGTTPDSPRRPNPPQSAAQPPSQPRSRSHSQNTAGYSQTLPAAYSQSSPKQSQRAPAGKRTANAVATPRTTPETSTVDYYGRVPSSQSRERMYSPQYQYPAVPTTYVSPKSPRTAQKLPKMTPWEPPSLIESPPRLRGGSSTPGNGNSAGSSRKNEREKPRDNGYEASDYGNGYGSRDTTVKGTSSSRTSTRTRTPEEVRAKEEKRKRVEVAEKKSRSSEGLTRRTTSSGKVKRRSRERLDVVTTTTASVGGEKTSRSSRRRR